MSRRGREALASVPLFSNLPPRHVRRLAERCEEHRYMSGATIVRFGEPGTSFFVILQGEAKVLSEGGRVLNRLLPGDFFGEISLLDGGPRTASVVAVTEMVLLVLPRDDFQVVLVDEPAVAVKLLQHAAGMLRRMQHLPTG